MSVPFRTYENVFVTLDILKCRIRRASVAVAMLITMWIGGSFTDCQADEGTVTSTNSSSQPVSAVADVYQWTFEKAGEQDASEEPNGWKRYEGHRYPKYVKIGIAAKDGARELELRKFDTMMIRGWRPIRTRFRSLPPLPPVAPFGSAPFDIAYNYLRDMPSLPPSLADLVVDRFLRIDLDGGLAAAQSPPVPTSHLYQYQFRCDIWTEGLQRDRARAELVFLDAKGMQIDAHSTPSIGGTTDWTTLKIDRTRPPLRPARRRRARSRRDRPHRERLSCHGRRMCSHRRHRSLPERDVVARVSLRVRRLQQSRPPTRTGPAALADDSKSTVKLGPPAAESLQPTSAKAALKRSESKGIPG